MGEPDWTKRFSNDNVCNYFYYLSVAILILAGFMVLMSAYLISVAPKALTSILVMSLVGHLAGLALSYFIYLFAYLTCTRSLIK
jgi:uncharacterized membrane-anchored protein